MRSMRIPLGIGLCLILWSCGASTQQTRLPILGPKQVQASGDTLFQTIGNYLLHNQDSSLIGPGLLEGKVYVADFFFTSCPSICPKMKVEMLRVHEAFKQNDRVAILSHSIDPRHDTVAVLRAYAEAIGVNGGNWHFLTGDQDKMYQIAENYMVIANEDPEAPGGFNHSDAFILIDTQRRVRGFYHGTDPESVDKLMVDIGRLLSETQPAKT